MLVFEVVAFDHLLFGHHLERIGAFAAGGVDFYDYFARDIEMLLVGLAQRELQRAQQGLERDLFFFFDSTQCVDKIGVHSAVLLQYSVDIRFCNRFKREFRPCSWLRASIMEPDRQTKSGR